MDDVTYRGHDREMFDERDLREIALKRLKARRGFQAHALAYVLVNGFLVVVWAMTGASFFWPVFPLFGWGIGLALNAWDVYSPEPSASRVQREVDRLRQLHR